MFSFNRDRVRTTSNTLDDCFAVAVIDKLTKNELDDMDLKPISTENEKMLQNV